ncbi:MULTISPECIES: hypothetical protein, partial [unclassified Mycobacterium]
APAGATPTDVVTILQALLDHHPMLRLRADMSGRTLTAPESGAARADLRLHSVDVLSEQALIDARSRLDPAAGMVLSALWVTGTGQLVLIVHHLAVDAVSWRILVEDFNIAWA